MKPILCLAFDGAVHDHRGGYDPVASPLQITGAAVPGAIDFIRDAMEHFRVCISTSRLEGSGADRSKAIHAVRWWLIEAGLPHNIISFGFEPPREGIVALLSGPPFGSLYLDPLGITFTGEWPDPESLYAPYLARAEAE